MRGALCTPSQGPGGERGHPCDGAPDRVLQCWGAQRPREGPHGRPALLCPSLPTRLLPRDGQMLPKAPGLPLGRVASLQCAVPRGAAGGARVQPRSRHPPPGAPECVREAPAKRLRLFSRVDLPSVNRVCKTLAENLGGLKKIYFLLPYEGLQADLTCR